MYENRRKIILTERMIISKKKKNYEITKIERERERKKELTGQSIKINRPVIEYVCRPI